MRLALAFPLALAACSLTALDGFTSGGGDDEPAPGADGGRDARTTAATDGATEAATPETDTYGDAVRADQPAAYFRFENDARDEMGRFTATPQDSVAWGTKGAVGNAARLTGGYFDLGDVFDFSGRVEFTLEAWVQYETGTHEYPTIFAKRDYAPGGRPNAGWIVYLYQPEMKLAFEFWRSQAVTGLVSIDRLPSGFASSFHHVVVTSTRRGNGLDYAVYLDGALAASDPNRTVEQPNIDYALAIGANWSGLIDEAAIYERALTPERIRAHYDAVSR